MPSILAASIIAFAPCRSISMLAAREMFRSEIIAGSAGRYDSAQEPQVAGRPQVVASTRMLDRAWQERT